MSSQKRKERREKKKQMREVRLVEEEEADEELLEQAALSASASSSGSDNAAEASASQASGATSGTTGQSESGVVGATGSGGDGGGASIRVYCENPLGVLLRIEVPEGGSVHQLKEILCDSKRRKKMPSYFSFLPRSNPFAQLCVLLNGRVLDDSATLSDVGVVDGSTVSVETRSAAKARGRQTADGDGAQRGLQVSDDGASAAAAVAVDAGASRIKHHRKRQAPAGGIDAGLSVKGATPKSRAAKGRKRRGEEAERSTIDDDLPLPMTAIVFSSCCIIVLIAAFVAPGMAFAESAMDDCADDTAFMSPRRWLSVTSSMAILLGALMVCTIITGAVASHKKNQPTALMCMVTGACGVCTVMLFSLVWCILGLVLQASMSSDCREKYGRVSGYSLFAAIMGLFLCCLLAFFGPRQRERVDSVWSRRQVERV